MCRGVGLEITCLLLGTLTAVDTFMPIADLETDPQKADKLKVKKGQWYVYEEPNPTDDYKYVIAYAVEDDWHLDVAKSVNIPLAGAIMQRITDLAGPIENGHLLRKKMN